MPLGILFGGTPGPFEILLVLFIILLLFGAKKLPDLSRALGKSLSEFKKGREEGLKSAEPPKALDPEKDEAPEKSDS
ncbi:MAG: twin-arginine translocase TatA/TatE family subunit [Verrucomicrobia bacterium]|jgi:sec-independent protein translocase protein TatA|nr:twin-arginine translocase TatA/TatE family subunit [Verrucomicrobiota bacterium]